MIPDDVLTTGALRALLADVADRDPVMVAIDGQAAACARRAEHDPGGRTLDILAGRLPGELGVDPARVALDTLAVSAGPALLALPGGEPTAADLASNSERGPDMLISGDSTGPSDGLQVESGAPPTDGGRGGVGGERSEVPGEERGLVERAGHGDL